MSCSNSCLKVKDKYPSVVASDSKVAEPVAGHGAVVTLRVLAVFQQEPETNVRKRERLFWKCCPEQRLDPQCGSERLLSWAPRLFMLWSITRICNLCPHAATLLIKGPTQPVLEGERITLECLYSDSELNISQVHFEVFSKVSHGNKWVGGWERK